MIRELLVVVVDHISDIYIRIFHAKTSCCCMYVLLGTHLLSAAGYVYMVYSESDVDYLDYTRRNVHTYRRIVPHIGYPYTYILICTGINYLHFKEVEVVKTMVPGRWSPGNGDS